MNYREIADGIFLDRPNRFIAHVEVNGVVETVHVKNTGRCCFCSAISGGTVWKSWSSGKDEDGRISFA